jgi:hypothetical protein
MATSSKRRSPHAYATVTPLYELPNPPLAASGDVRDIARAA